MFSMLQVTVVVFWLISPLSRRGSAYELHDTIHTLKEENFHLQQRLENLTRALRDLKHLLKEHKVSGGKRHDTDYLHTWREWSRHGISTETHQMLQQALCLTELHSAASPSFITSSLLLLLILVLFLSPLVTLTLLS
ncbi:hypothetical protein INR49_017383 [Caranx melampygus]|nr:hypothetical protein INR49_017383 [Caranx melampygus]